MFSCSFNSILLSLGSAISIRWHFLSVLHSTTILRLLSWQTWSDWILKFHNILTLSFSTTFAGFWLYHLTSPTKPNFWHSSKCTIFAILSCLCLHFFCASFLHSAIKWVFDSCLSYLWLFYLFIEKFNDQWMHLSATWGSALQPRSYEKFSHNFQRLLLSSILCFDFLKFSQNRHKELQDVSIIFQSC